MLPTCYTTKCHPSFHMSYASSHGNDTSLYKNQCSPPRHEARMLRLQYTSNTCFCYAIVCSERETQHFFLRRQSFQATINTRKRNAIDAPAKRNALTTQSPATLPTCCTTEPRRSSYTLYTANLETDNISDTTD